MVGGHRGHKWGTCGGNRMGGQKGQVGEEGRWRDGLKDMWVE